MSKTNDKPAWNLRVGHILETGEQLSYELTPVRLREILFEVDSAYDTIDESGLATFSLSRLREQVAVLGRVTAQLKYTRSRCLAVRDADVDAAIKWTFLPVDQYRDDTSSEELELTAEDLDVSFYEGDTIDLFEIVRDVLLLELPAHPCCDGECIDKPLTSHEDAGFEDEELKGVDPRWAALLKLRDKKRD